jgi:hypothetical protein
MFLEGTRTKTLKPVLKKTFTVEKILMDRNYSSSSVEGILLERITRSDNYW